MHNPALHQLRSYRSQQRDHKRARPQHQPRINRPIAIQLTAASAESSSSSQTAQRRRQNKTHSQSQNSVTFSIRKSITGSLRPQLPPDRRRPAHATPIANSQQINVDPNQSSICPRSSNTSSAADPSPISAIPTHPHSACLPHRAPSCAPPQTPADHAQTGSSETATGSQSEC